GAGRGGRAPGLRARQGAAGGSSDDARPFLCRGVQVRGDRPRHGMSDRNGPLPPLRGARALEETLRNEGCAMTCDEVRPALDALVDGELAREEERVLRGHLAGCAACARELEERRAFSES